ncbi:MAG: immunoglobulin domain-containing protein [Verrucomicrobia bacterium]|nr:immunoglobulin domain-containing protein [Verrucomicrobiota bacterium]
MICVEDDGNGKMMVYHWDRQLPAPLHPPRQRQAVGPVIVTQPPKIVHPLDKSSLDLSVITVGENLSFQWYKNGAAISGATSDSFHKDNVTAADNGNYTVTVSKGTTSLTSTATAVSLVYPSIH